MFLFFLILRVFMVVLWWLNGILWDLASGPSGKRCTVIDSGEYSV